MLGRRKINQLLSPLITSPYHRHDDTNKIFFEGNALPSKHPNNGIFNPYNEVADNYLSLIGRNVLTIVQYKLYYA